jgi:hypothetical protein
MTLSGPSKRFIWRLYIASLIISRLGSLPTPGISFHALNVWFDLSDLFTRSHRAIARFFASSVKRGQFGTDSVGTGQNGAGLGINPARHQRSGRLSPNAGLLADGPGVCDLGRIAAVASESQPASELGSTKFSADRSRPSSSSARSSLTMRLNTTEPVC